jgi:hypothetical protein
MSLVLRPGAPAALADLAARAADAFDIDGG